MAVFWKNDTITAAMSRSGLVKEIEPLNNPSILISKYRRKLLTAQKIQWCYGLYRLVRTELITHGGWGANAWWVRQDVLEDWV